MINILGCYQKVLEVCIIISTKFIIGGNMNEKGNGKEYWEIKSCQQGDYIDYEKQMRERILSMRECSSNLRKYLDEVMSAIESDKNFNNIIGNGKYIEELDKTYSMMTTPDFHAKNWAHEPIKKLMDSEVDYNCYTSILLEGDDEALEDNHQKVKEFIQAYRDKCDEANKQDSKIIKGFGGEYDVTEQLVKKLNSSYLKILSGVYFDKYEHDLIIISEKGVYTVEIKNHSGTLKWENGGFSESIRGLVKEGEIKDPYIQCLNHKKSLANVIDEKYFKSIILFANERVEYSADDPEIRNSIFYLEDFVQMFNASNSAFSLEKADELFNIIQEKRIYKENKFKYVDMEKADSLYRDWLSKIEFYDNNKDLPLKISERYEKEKKVYAYVNNICYLNRFIKNGSLNELQKPKDAKTKIKGQLIAILIGIIILFPGYHLSGLLDSVVNKIDKNELFLSLILSLGGIVVSLACLILVFAIVVLTFITLFDGLRLFVNKAKEEKKIEAINQEIALANQMRQDNMVLAKETIDMFKKEYPEIIEICIERGEELAV